MRKTLRGQARLLERKADGNLFFADDSLPETATPISSAADGWRCQAAPRIHLLLAGRHSLTFLKKSRAATVSLSPGDVWYFPPDAHDNETFTTPCRYIVALFLKNVTRFVIVTHAAAGSPDAKSRREAGRPSTREWMHWHAERPAAVDATLAALHETLRNESPEAGWHLARALWLLLDDWMRRTTTEPMPLGKAHASWLAVDRYLQENYHRPLDRNVVAQALGLHQNRISTLCSEFGEKSFHALLEERRLRQAKRFLKDSEHKVETIAALCGYVNVASFFRVFRQAAGMTPGEWRLRNRSAR